MEAKIIRGKEIANKSLSDLKEKIIQDRKYHSFSIKLIIILVGDNHASKIYIKNKIKAAERVGIEAKLKKFDLDISEEILIEYIHSLNKDLSVSGIITQLPLPDHIREENVIKSIDPFKDVDGLHPTNTGLLYSQYRHSFIPCTAKGCLDLINSCITNLSGKNIAVVGRSNIVGRPLAALLLKEDCTVTICHSRTVNLKSITRQADIVILAIGKAKYFTKEYFNSNAMVIDVGINRIDLQSKNQICGDVDFDNVKDHVKYITPVPGGVGPMTVANLLINTYLAKIKSMTLQRR